MLPLLIFNKSWAKKRRSHQLPYKRLLPGTSPDKWRTYPYFSTDITKQQTTLNPTFPKGCLLGSKRVVWWWGEGVDGRSVQRRRFCERWSLWFLASLSCLPPIGQHLSNEGATISGFKNSAFYPQPLFISIVRPQSKQRLFPFKALTGLYKREGVCLLRGTDWIFKSNSD